MTASSVSSPNAVSAIVLHMETGTPWHVGSTGRSGAGTGAAVASVGPDAPPPVLAPGSDHDSVDERSWLPSASVTTVSIAPDSAVHVPDTHDTSIETGTVFGSDRATEATASSHFAAGMPVQEIRAEAGGLLLTGAPQPAIARTAITASARRSVVLTAQDTHPDLVLNRVDHRTENANGSNRRSMAGPA